MDGVMYKRVQVNGNSHDVLELFAANKDLAPFFAIWADLDPSLAGNNIVSKAQADNNNDNCIVCKLTIIEKDRFFTYEWDVPTSLKHPIKTTQQLINIILLFVEESMATPVSTSVHALLSGWKDRPEWEAVKRWLDAVWNQVLIELGDDLIIKH